ncbi:Wadjet anti-phage system protein JetA family protein [Labrys monachus]|uniref:Uncharacterized protein n=1 Tax=Labrys monachus TaxID=217067 RepID=A0ABU0FEK8_9HYPH|nr:Wadjet anti-phage system protein JetA family protein [Labrys monachus]MDQ0392881.1 hypothetical protein [Labrys monachus]
MLFGALDPDIFMLFSGENRRLYEEVLVKIYDSCFGSDLLFPTQNELVGIIYDILAERPGLWHEEGALVTLDEISSERRRRLRRRRQPGAHEQATGEAMARARHIYARLLQTGWLEESRYGLRITVDMPAGAMRLAEFLCTLREGSMEQLGGLVIEVKNALEGVRASAKENALGLHKAARDAVGFGRYLRSVLSALREIDRHVMESESLNERLQHYFEDFVERVLLKDYAAIATTSHPYRFRHRIFDVLQSLEDSPVDIESLAAAYHEAGLAPAMAAARDLVFDDLDKIRRVFQRIDEAFRRIQQHRGQLEARLRNTVRYAGRRADAYLRRSEQIILRLDRLTARHAGDPRAPTIPGHLDAVRAPFAPELLARPRRERSPIVSGVLALPAFDPLRELRKQLERAYLARIAIRPRQVLRFLERRVPPFGSTEAKHLAIDDLDDFLAFETLRHAVRGVMHGKEEDLLARHLARHFAFDAGRSGIVDNEWLTCENFHIRRKDDHVSLEVDFAD